MSLLVLSASEVDTILPSLTPVDLQILMATVFSFLSSPTSYTPYRSSIQTQNHTALFMPARMANDTTVKLVCVPRDPSDTRGIPASTVVLDHATGAVKAIVNARNLTPIRNAAASLLSTNIVRLRPASLVAFGAGKQIQAHLRLHLTTFSSITSCTIINRTLNSRLFALQHHIEPLFPTVSFQYIANIPDESNKIKKAVSNASLIICATSSMSPLFPSSWVQSWTHVILIGSYTPAMHEVDSELVRRAMGDGLLLVDSRTACAAEAGELIEAGVDGSQVVEIGELVKVSEQGELSLLDWEAKGEGQRGAGPITMFKSVGVGLQDVAIACAVVDKAEHMVIGTRVDSYDCL